MKTDTDFFQVWGGISGIQHLLPLILDAGFAADLCSEVAARNPARRFRLQGKGELVAGADADLVLVEPHVTETITADSLLYRHRHSPYVGRTLKFKVRRTILRGQTVCRDGVIVGEPRGKLLTPS